MTNTESMRARLLDAAGVVDVGSAAAADAAGEQVRALFGTPLKFMLREARARLLMGYFRYVQPGHSVAVLARLGLVDDYTTKLRTKLDLYDQTGNREFLVDALSYCLLEFADPCRENTYYESTERYD